MPEAKEGLMKKFKLRIAIVLMVMFFQSIYVNAKENNNGSNTSEKNGLPKAYNLLVKEYLVFYKVTARIQTVEFQHECSTNRLGL